MIRREYVVNHTYVNKFLAPCVCQSVIFVKSSHNLHASVVEEIVSSGEIMLSQWPQLATPVGEVLRPDHTDGAEGPLL